MRRRWQYRGVGRAITLSKPTAYLSADSHEVSCAPGGSQSDGDETQSRGLIEPAYRGADSLSRTDVDAIGDEESLAVTDPRGDHHRDPDSHFRSEYVDRHPVGDYQPIADGNPVAVLVSGGRACRNGR